MDHASSSTLPRAKLLTQSIDLVSKDKRRAGRGTGAKAPLIIPGIAASSSSGIVRRSDAVQIRRGAGRGGGKPRRRRKRAGIAHGRRRSGADRREGIDTAGAVWLRRRAGGRGSSGVDRRLAMLGTGEEGIGGFVLNVHHHRRRRLGIFIGTIGIAVVHVDVVIDVVVDVIDVSVVVLKIPQRES